jgi:hypothetical protein
MVAGFARAINAATAWPFGTRSGRVLVETPEGQLSWSYDNEHSYLFQNLPMHTKPWDGSDEVTVYKRMHTIIAKIDEYSSIAHKEAKDKATVDEPDDLRD